MKTRQAILLLLLVLAGIGAFYANSYMDQNFVVLKNGTVITADEIWESGNVIFYEVENEIFVVNQVEVDSFGGPDLESSLKHVKYTILNLLREADAELNDFAFDTTVSFGQKSVWLISIVAATVFCIIVILALHLVRNNRHARTKPSQPSVDEDLESTSYEDPEGDITQSDIIKYFLTLFRLQIGASPDSEMNTKILSGGASDSNFVYELRIKHRGDWVRRRMTIGPLGVEAGSKSKCFYVIYDIHLVVKIPVKPITRFDDYIESIKKEGQIVDKLAPRECIIPRVSVILNLINKLPETAHLPAERLEEKYVTWLRRNTDHQKYLKIKNTFVFFMDFSQYYFLGHIVDNLHDLKDAAAEEIIENTEAIFDNNKFRGRYGKAKESIGIEIRQVYNNSEAAIRQFLTDSAVSSDVSMFRIQTWFLTHLAGKSVPIKEAGLSENLVKELNLLIELNFSKQMDAVEAYRATINEYVHKIRFEQNKPQMAGIITNLLDLLAWLRTKRVAMRDLKPDNLLVAGDPAKYPLFLMKPDEYALGIIDVETAVDFERSKHRKVMQPLLGGTPFYATPSHFFNNAILIDAFKNLNKILHLQDWYATMVMVYKAVTGGLMFEHTARLFADLRNKIKFGQMEGMLDTEIVADVSRSFWRSALIEFQTKMNQKENELKSILIPIPETAKQMFKYVLKKDIDASLKKIKLCVGNQTVFESPESQQRLLNSSPQKIDQLRAEFGNKVKSMPKSSADHSGTIVLLKYLLTLKLHTEQQKQLLKRLELQGVKISAYTLLGFMFNNLYKSMFREEWWVKPTAEEKSSDGNVDEATLEATI